MSFMERVERLGQPQGALTADQAIKVLAASTIAQRDGYKDAQGRVIEANVALAVHTSDALGLPRLRALDWVYIVNGAAKLTADAQRVLARREGYDLAFPDEEQTWQVGTAYIRKGRSEWRKATFTMDDAKKAKLTGKDNWEKYGRDMLTARACTRVISRYAAEVLAGLPAGEWSDGPDVGAAALADGRPDEPAIDADELAYIVDHVRRLPEEQRSWFASHWMTDLECPSLLEGVGLTRAHGALARYMLDDAEQAADQADALAALDDVDSPEAAGHDTYRYD